MKRKKMATTNHLNLLSAISLLAVYSAAVIVGAETGVNDADLLIRFKSSLPNPDILPNWKPGQNPCLFTRVTCDSELRITSIDLSFLSLSPVFHSVSDHLLPLPNLTSLTLKSTNLTGPIAAFSDCSASLTLLDLSLNSLSGDLSAFAPCSSLSTLNLSSNSLEGSFVNSHYSLPLTLKTLDLSSNHLTGNSFLPWLISGGGCPHFTSLTLKDNKLNGPFSFNGCDSLQFVDLSGNNFSTPIPNLGRCAQLKHLDLSSNKFTGPIGDELSKCEDLINLNISSNQFSGPIPPLPTSNLQFLYLAGNQFEGVLSEALLVSSSCPLIEVDLSDNHFSGNLPTGLDSCTSLTLFDVSYNNFSGDLPIHVFLNMNGLKKLSLASNLFVGVLPESISLFNSLESLDLSSNNISGEIPSGLCGNLNLKSSLKELYLQDNQLTGVVPSDLGNCSNLVSLDLSFNYLNGMIPPSLGSLLNLKDLIMWMNHLEGEIPQELMNVKSLENLILDYNKLRGNIPSGLRNCTNLNWISLSSNQLSGVIPSWIGTLTNLAILKLSNNSFYGSIPPELGDCKSLLWLDLNSNLLSGSIPSKLSKQSGSMAVGLVVGKKYVYLRNDGGKECHGVGNLLEFAGIRQDSLNRIPTRDTCNFTRIYRGNTQPTFQHNGSMIFLDLSFNMLEGSIPKELGSMSYLSILDLAHNNLSGPIPSELGGMTYIGVMDLSFNHLSGPIPPSLSGLTLLSEIDLSNNNLTGMIPSSSQFETFPASRFYNNSGLCGYPLPSCSNESASSASQHQRRRKRGTLAGSVAMGLMVSLFCIFGVIILYVELNKRKKNKKNEESNSDGNPNSGAHHTNWKLTSAREALSINLAAFEKPLQKLTFADLLKATNGFHDDSMIGSGGFGDVYKAKLKDGSLVAIKKLIQLSGQGDREFTAEMETIGKIKHRNLVPLLGYCKVGDERLLVYEYMQHGSLEDVLHDRKKAGIKLDWATRRKIAIGAARGLAFLHHNCIPHIIHRDMKSSNVLLDENLEARVSDFGMARLMSAMDTHLSVSTLAGTPGYVPPEYYQSFRCSTKGDVYSYGVVLLELLTGKQPTDSADFGDNNLVGWVKQHAKMRISDVFDTELIKEDPGLEMELLQHLKVACSCLDDRPWRRPTMIQVMAMFKEIQAGSGLDSTSSIGADDGIFPVGGIEMTIKEDIEMGKL